MLPEERAVIAAARAYNEAHTEGVGFGLLAKALFAAVDSLERAYDGPHIYDWMCGQQSPSKAMRCIEPRGHLLQRDGRLTNDFHRGVTRNGAFRYWSPGMVRVDASGDAA